MRDTDVQNLLRSREAQKMGFAFQRLRVGGRDFLELSNYFALGCIPRQILFLERPEEVRPNLARYNARSDTIRVSTHTLLDTPYGRGVVLHECTHALLDLRGLSSSERTEEALAWIAEAWYYLNCGMSNVVNDHGFPAVILAIAEDLRVQYLTNNQSETLLSSAQINNARQVMRDRRYGNRIYRSNGIRERSCP